MIGAWERKRIRQAPSLGSASFCPADVFRYPFPALPFFPQNLLLCVRIGIHIPEADGLIAVIGSRIVFKNAECCFLGAVYLKREFQYIMFIL